MDARARRSGSWVSAQRRAAGSPTKGQCPDSRAPYRHAGGGARGASDACAPRGAAACRGRRPAPTVVPYAYGRTVFDDTAADEKLARAGLLSFRKCVLVVTGWLFALAQSLLL